LKNDNFDIIQATNGKAGPEYANCLLKLPRKLFNIDQLPVVMWSDLNEGNHVSPVRSRWRVNEVSQWGLYQGCQSVPLLFNLNWVIFASSVNLIGSSSHDPCSNKTYTVLFYTRSFWDKSWKAAINNRGSAECLLVRRAFVYGYWTDTARCTFLC